MSDQTFVLVHGGAHTSRSWYLLQPELSAYGYDSVTVDLPPAHPDLSLSDDADAIINVVSGVKGPVVLVGHSLNGLAIPLAAARHPINSLVFVCAVVPEIGKALSIADDEVQVSAEVQEAIRFRPDGTYTMDPVLSLDVFYNATPPDVAEWAVSDLVPQANVAAMTTPLTEWPHVPTYSIIGRHDRSVPPQWGRKAARELFGVDAIELASDHSPFLSRPGELANVLVDIAQGKYPAGQGR